MRHAYFLCCLLLLPLVSCEEGCIIEPEIPVCPPIECSDGTYVPGDLLVGMKTTTTLPQTFQLLNSNSFTIKSIMGPAYISSLPADSIDYVVRELNQKPYISANGWRAVKGGGVYLHSQTGALTVIVRLMNLTPAYQQDWLATVQRLQLQEQPTMVKSCHLGVPLCSEKYWQGQMQQNGLVEWAELNKMSAAQPGG